MTRRKGDAKRRYSSPILPAGLDTGTRRAFAQARRDEPTIKLRMDLLRTIEARAPQVLADLEAVRVTNDPHAYGQWFVRYRLDAAWMRRVAWATLELWDRWPSGRGRRWDMNGMVDQSSNGHIPDRGRLPAPPPAIVKTIQHLDWFVDHRCRNMPFSQIRNAWSPSAVQKAVARLARALEFSDSK